MHRKIKIINTAIKILKGLQDYKDSKNLLIYYEALEQSESKQVEDIQKTVEALKSIPQVKIAMNNWKIIKKHGMTMQLHLVIQVNMTMQLRS